MELMVCSVSCVVLIKHSAFNFTRDSVVEILFEQDNEEKSVATLILDSLMQVFLFCKKFKFMIAL